MGNRASAGGTAEALSHAPVDSEKLSHGLYHEKQLRSLCAVHCMNNLVQGPYFDEVNLVEVAHGLDAQERVALGGAWLEGQASGNAREDGFSVQAIQEALSRQGLSCIPFGAESARGALNDPCAETGFILNRCATTKVYLASHQYCIFLTYIPTCILTYILTCILTFIAHVSHILHISS
jgi:hypothetical protein